MLACAVLTEELAHACAIRDDRAYTAGLLHDVGRLGLLLAYPAEYAEILRNFDRTALELLDCEREGLGMDHCEAGRMLASHWGLPADFRIIAARHHDPPGNSRPDLLSLVHLGCRLADSLGFWVVKPLQPVTPEDIHASLPPLLRDRIRIDAARWREIVDSRINSFQDADGSVASFPPFELTPQEEPEPPVGEFAEMTPPDLCESRSLIHDLCQLVGLGMLFTTLIVVIVYFSVR
jgi:hypothetical protein